MGRSLWGLWTTVTVVLALTAMVLCVSPGRADFVSLDRLPAVSAAPDLPAAEGLVNINTAGLEELTKLPEIGEVRAQAIIDYREANGPFRYPEELIYVPGIGEGTLNGLLDLITTGGGDHA